MSDLRIGSLCSGYGGLDMAVQEVLGGSVAWHCQYDPDDRHQYAARILDHHSPAVPNHGDIKRIDWDTVERPEILTAGYPCQPFSFTGHRKGTADERHLWPYVASAVRHLRPGLIVLENVAGHRSLGFGRVLADLAGIGYVGSWRSVRAWQVGATHDRERVFIAAWPAVADANDLRRFRPGSAQRATQRHAAGEDRPTDPLWREYTPAIARWSGVLGRPAPHPVEVGERAGERLSPAFAEWHMGLPEGHITAVPAIPYGAQHKAIGNGVVPQQAAYALRLLLDRMGQEVAA
jgi:DNA (cytosine-5)-methyltransferase 1